MSSGIGFGAGVGAVSILAALLAVSPAVRGDVEQGKTKETDTEVRKPAHKVDRRVRIAFGGGSHLGIRLEDVDKEDVARLKLPEEKGALVKQVDDDSPAAKAGIQEGDVIVRYHGESVLGAAQLARLVRETPAGRTVPIEVVRNGAPQKLSATIGSDEHGAWDLGKDWGAMDIPLPEVPEPPVPPAAPVLPRGFDRWGKRALLDELAGFGRGPRKLGIEYQEISGQLAKYFKVSGDNGVLVTTVDPEGPAGKAGLKAGDVILKLGTRPIEDGEDLRKALERAEPGSEVSLSIQREGRSLDLKVTLAGERRAKPGVEL
jgi:serine protease Do